MSPRSITHPSELLEHWMEWEKGVIPPGRLLSDPKNAGMPELLDELVRAADER